MCKHFRVIYHSGFYLTQLLIVGCMFNLFSVVLFGLDGALVSFEELQWVCKVRFRLFFPPVLETSIIAEALENLPINRDKIFSRNSEIKNKNNNIKI